MDVQKIKRITSDIKIATGGSNVQKSWFNKFEFYDYICTGEGEAAILSILDDIENGVERESCTHPQAEMERNRY